jgi:hypothetical protein
MTDQMTAVVLLLVPVGLLAWVGLRARRRLRSSAHGFVPSDETRSQRDNDSWVVPIGATDYSSSYDSGTSDAGLFDGGHSGGGGGGADFGSDAGCDAGGSDGGGSDSGGSDSGGSGGGDCGGSSE